MIERFDVRCDRGNPIREQFRLHHLELYREAARAIREYAHGGDRLIVDAASGMGHGFSFLADLGEYVGVERDDAALVASRDRYPTAEFRHADLDSRHCFRGLAPDVVVSLETAEHLARPDEFLRRVSRALPNHGLFVFSVPTCLTRDFDRFHLWDWRASTWSALLTEAGFAIERSRTCSVSGSFREFCATLPTSPWQKIGVALFDLTHPIYLVNRIWNWLLLGRFCWESTLFVCRKAKVH